MTEHRRPNGNLSQGYYCAYCGMPCNMYASGHFDANTDRHICEYNPELVQALDLANPSPGTKPRYKLDL